jgi:N-acetyl-anhydromuramyl-L-alanine amidase AmpD
VISTYPRAVVIGAAAENIGGPLEPSSVRLFVLHVAQGNNQSGIDAWFRDPLAKVSAHFSIARNGTVHQHVPLIRVAWAEQDYNDVAISIEHLGYSGKRLTRRQLKSSLMLLTWLHEQFPRVPLRRTARPDGYGVIGHGELGILGGDHPSCPGTPILDQVARALGSL